MLGSSILVGSFFAWKDIRTTSRKVLVWISICDFVIALGNMCGTFFKPTSVDYKCYVQSFIVSSALISSFLWSVTLAICLYMTIVKGRADLFQAFLPCLHIFNWTLGFVINIIALCEHWLGNSADQITAGWCWIKHNRSDTEIPQVELLWMVLDYKGIEIVAYGSILFIFLMIKLELKKEVKGRAPNSSQLSRRSTVIKAARRADQKLVMIPVLLILARLPGTIRFLIVAANRMPQRPKHWSLTLMYLQGIGDSAQGMLNCIFFCFLQKKVRQHLLDAFHQLHTYSCFKRKLESSQVQQDNMFSNTVTDSKTPLLGTSKLVPKYN